MNFAVSGQWWRAERTSLNVRVDELMSFNLRARRHVAGTRTFRDVRSTRRHLRTGQTGGSHFIAALSRVHLSAVVAYLRECAGVGSAGMKTVTVEEVASNFQALLRIVQRGEELNVVRRR